MTSIDIKELIKNSLCHNFDWDIGGKEYTKSAASYIYVAPTGHSIDNIVEWEVRVNDNATSVELIAGVDDCHYSEKVIKAWEIPADLTENNVEAFVAPIDDTLLTVLGNANGTVRFPI